jgi:hypothetical protein
MATALLVFGATLAPWPQAAQASGWVQQCRTADGQSLYTDKPCRAIGAQPVPMRSELATRIVRERAHEAKVSGVEVGFIPTTLSMRSAARNAIGRRSVAGGCARTPTQLAMDLRGAFALGDVNRIAESYHWVGMSQQGATATMQRLERLSRHDILDAHYYDARLTMANADDAGFGGAAGVMQVTFSEGSGPGIQDFDVERHGGCYFVRF